LDRGRWLLQNTNLRVADIAVETGFQSGAHFGRAIKRAFLFSPLKLRVTRHVITRCP
jgi:transcriptional regulator GlxA family with amidase domain